MQHTKQHTHLECKSIPIDDILQRLWIKTAAEESLSVYKQCYWDMGCKEYKEDDPSVSLKRQHDNRDLIAIADNGSPIGMIFKIVR